MRLRSDGQHQRSVPGMWGSRDGEGGGMRRKLFTFFSLLSLLICVATVVLWGRSRRIGESSCWGRRGGNLYCVQSDRSALNAGVLGPWPCDENRWFTTLSPECGGKSGPRHRLGFGVEIGSLTGSVNVDANHKAIWSFAGFGSGPSAQYSAQFVRIPWWVMVAVSAIFPLIWVTSQIRGICTRREHGHCPTCSYNLAGNISGVCPECGTAVEAGVTP